MESLAGEPYLGRELDRYRIEAPLGSGGSGRSGLVFRARHTLLDREVALKIYRSERETHAHTLERFIREARAAAGLGSPHIVHILDAGLTPDGEAFLVMELLDGMDLEQLLASGGPLPLSAAAGIARQILTGLEAAHVQGIVHRDINPSNIFIARRSAGPSVVKLLDFGASRLATSTTQSKPEIGAPLGSPDHAAPEQIRAASNVDARADLYAVGSVLYAALTGRPPFCGIEGLRSKISGAPPPDPRLLRPEIPAPLAETLLAALAPEPEARPSSARSMRRALEAACVGLEAEPPRLEAEPPRLEADRTWVDPVVDAGPQPAPAAPASARIRKPWVSTLPAFPAPAPDPISGILELPGPPTPPEGSPRIRPALETPPPAPDPSAAVALPPLPPWSMSWLEPDRLRAACANLMVIIEAGAPTRASWIALSEEAHALAQREGRRIGILEIVEPGVEFESGGSEIASATWAAVDPQVLFVAHLVAGTDLRARKTREAVEQISLMACTVSPHRIFKSAEEALRWLCAQIERTPAEVAAILEQMDRARRAAGG